MGVGNMSGLDHRLLSVTAASFDRYIRQGARVELALSGGLDSVVLLHLLKRLRAEKAFFLSAVHVHHGLQPEADAWPSFCENLCKTWQIALRIAYVKPNTAKVGIEAGARAARYSAFAQGVADVVALAHHRDDQVETFMLSALRGGGIRGLSAMPQWRCSEGAQAVWRPLLTVTRRELADYAQAHGLPYIEDPSNSDGGLLRNWLRNQGLPAWRNRLPMLDEHVASSIRLLQRELAVLEEVSESDWAEVCRAGFFDCTVWRGLSPGRRARLLLLLARRERLGMPAQASLDDFCRVLYDLGKGFAQWDLPQGRVYAYQNRLFGIKNDWLAECGWLNRQGLSENQGATLREILDKEKFKLCRRLYGLCEDVLGRAGNVRPVATDDVIELTVGHKKVRKLLQECKIPPFVRNYWPVITDEENRCIAVANLWVHPDYVCANGIFPYFEKFSCFVLEPK